MVTAVVGRLYERSCGEISVSGVWAFPDCNYDEYYAKYVDWAAENGEFKPGNQVTRQQMAAILYRFANFLGTLPDDMDTELSHLNSAAMSGWAKGAALFCQTAGILLGRDGENVALRDMATRAAVAAILERFVENTLD